MNFEIALRLSVLIPFIYAGLYALVDPVSSIRVVNKIMADAHRIEASVLWGELFAEPKPITDSRGCRAGLRIAGVAMMLAGLIRLYSL